MTTTYICGPMSGHENHNESAFREVAKMLDERGVVAVVPHDVEAVDHDGPCPRSHPGTTTGDHAAACYLRADLVHLLIYCDDVYVLRGWETSVGARLEVQVAAACGIPLEFQS